MLGHWGRGSGRVTAEAGVGSYYHVLTRIPAYSHLRVEKDVARGTRSDGYGDFPSAIGRDRVERGKQRALPG